jgi:hypothetical protein
LVPNQLARLDAWIGEQDDKPSRPEAVRRLFEIGLSVDRGGVRKIPVIVASGDARAQSRVKSRKTAKKAADLAAAQLDKLGDPSLPAEEHQMRKRRLIKGPREFRDIRADQPGAKRR